MELLLALIGLATALVGVWQQYVARQAAGVPNPSLVGSPLPVQSIPVEARSRFLWGGVARDAGVTFAASAILGFFVGVAYADSSFEEALPAIAAVNIISVLVGFLISAVAASGNRWRHLAAVGLVLWILSFVNVLAEFSTFGQWFLGLFLLGICAIISGGVSFLIKKG